MSGARLRAEAAARSLASRFPYATERLVPYASRREQVALRARGAPRSRPSRSSRGNERPQLLVIDKYIPTPDRDSGSVRMSAMLEIFSELGADVAFAPATRLAPEPYASRVEALGVRVVAGRRGIEEFLQEVGPMAAAVLSRAPVARAYVPLIRAAHPNARLVYDTVDLQWVRESRRGELEGSARRDRVSAAMRHRDLAVIDSVDATIAITEEEAARIREALPSARVHVVPNIHDVPPLATISLPERRSVLFVGNFRHDPNVDAAVWLARTIAPRFLRSLSDVRVLIAGGAAPPEVANLASRNVSVLGWVPDLAPLYDQARVVVAPLRYGAGMKGKVGEAMSHGVPVVTTTVGAEGFDVAGRGLVVADDAERLAREVIRLYEDDTHWQESSDAARRYIGQRFSREAVRTTISELLESVGVSPRRS